MPSRPNRPGPILAIAAAAAFLATFNETFLNVAFTPIMADFGIDEPVVHWLVTGYMLAAAVMVPVTAFLYRRFPTRPLFLVTVGLLIVGSVIGALAPTFPVLLAGRLLQALGTGMLIPIGMNLTLAVAPREKLGLYMGLMGSMITLGPSLSVITAGGLLTVAPWSTLLWVFGGLALVCFVAGALLLRNFAELTRPKLDAVSVGLIAIALVGLLYGISTVFSGNPVTAAVAAIIGAVVLVLFVRRQGRLEQPLLDVSTLRIRPFALGVVMNMLTLVIIFAMNILIPVYLQSVRGVPALNAAFTLFPAIVLSAVIAPLAGRYYDNHGPRILLPVGFGLIAVFATLVAMVIPTGSLVLVACLFVPLIGGTALVVGPVQTFALSHLSHRQHPHGVTVMSTGFQVAGCIGSSLFVGVYAATAASAGGSPATAAGTGFLVAGLLAAGFALVGLVLGVIAGRHAVRPAPHATSVEAAVAAG